MNASASILVLGLCLLLALPPFPAPVQEEPAVPVQELTVQKVKPGNLTGIVTDSAGNRLAGRNIELKTVTGKLIGTAKSNPYGMYQIKNIPEGEFILAVNNQPATRLIVTNESTVSMLMFVVPVSETGLTTTQWTLIGVGAVAVAVAVPVIIHNTDDSSSKRVSP